MKFKIKADYNIDEITETRIKSLQEINAAFDAINEVINKVNTLLNTTDRKDEAEQVKKEVYTYITNQIKKLAR